MSKVSKCDVEKLGYGDVGGVVGREVVAEFPHA